MHGTKFRRSARDYTYSSSSLPTNEIVILAPPPLQPSQGGIGVWFQVLLPVVGSLGSLIFIFAYNPPLFLIIAAICMALLMVASGVAMRFQQQWTIKKQQKVVSKTYKDYLSGLSIELSKTAELQRQVNAYLYPPLPKLVEVVAQRNREQPQLWERRLEDQDFLHVRVGLGATQLCRTIRLDFGNNPFTQYVPELRIQAEKLANDYKYLNNAPIVVELATIGSLAITGSSTVTRAFMRAILCQIAAFHSPEEVRFVTYFPASAAQEWNWLKWLPHARRLHQIKLEKQNAPDPLCLLADNVADFQELLIKQVTPELTRRQQLSEHKKESATELMRPHIILVLDGFTPDGEVAQLPDIQKSFQPPETNGIDPAKLRVTLVCLVNTIRQEPSAIKARITVSNTGDLTFQKLEVGGSRIEGIVADAANLQICEQIARSLAPLSLADKTGQQDLSQDVRLLDLLSITSADEIQITKTWHPQTTLDMLRVPIGQRADGTPLLLDLKEAADKGMGPHGLVVGATGSGKSELLRTLVTSLGITHDPYMVNFLLVDFKGGASFADFASMPHVAGIVTNLKSDQMLVNRVYESLQGEQERRQRMLREAGNFDKIQEYHAKWQANRSIMQPMPHLMIIVDEFAELISSRPDFLDLFVQIGRVGRSLGMHLLLATQRLEEGRLKGLETYLRYRICLRTFSTAESSIALGNPDAFYLPSAPGVGYFKVDANIPTLFKTALISTPYVPVTEQTTPAALLREFTSTGKLVTCNLPTSSISSMAGHDRITEDERLTEMDIVIKRLASAQSSGNQANVHQVCLPPLDKTLTLDTVFGQTGQNVFDGSRWPATPAFGPLRIPIGLIDKPLEQVQEPLFLDFSGAGGHLAFVGSPQSGKSTLLRTIVTSFMMTHPPRDVQIYGIDLGGGLLRVFETATAQAPHVGSICNRMDREKIRRLVRQMHTIIEERTILFQERGIDSMMAYRMRRQAGELSDKPFGDVFLLIDNLAQLRHDFDQLDTELMDIIATGLTYGVHVILTVNRWAEVPPKLLQNFGTRLELHIHDAVESDIGKALAAALPAGIPGRGLTKEKFYFQTALPQVWSGKNVQNVLPQQTLETFVQQAQKAWKGTPTPPIRMLPKEVTNQDLPRPGTNQQQGVPIGVDEFRLAPVYIDLVSAGPHFLIFGDTECGKTNLFRIWIHGLEQRYTPEQVQIAIVDYRRTLLDIAQAKSPHLFAYTYTPTTLKDSINRLGFELEKRLQSSSQNAIELFVNAPRWEGPHYFLFVDDYETIVSPSSNPFNSLGELLYHARDIGFHLVLARRAAGASASSFDQIIKRLKDMESPGLIMSGSTMEGPLIGMQKASPFPPGRGHLVRRKHPPTQVQIAFDTSKEGAYKP